MLILYAFWLFVNLFLNFANFTIKKAHWSPTACSEYSQTLILGDKTLIKRLFKLKVDS